MRLSIPILITSLEAALASTRPFELIGNIEIPKFQYVGSCNVSFPAQFGAAFEMIDVGKG